MRLTRRTLLPRPARLADGIRRRVAARVIDTFNDRAAGQRPVVRSPHALMRVGSPAWRVHGDVVAMMVGGIASLLLQMLHPAVLAGVWDHSSFRTDMLGRLRRTARFIALTTYAPRDEALAAIERVRRIHAHVHGTLPDGTPYRADDPAALAWVHATETHAFLAAYRRYGAAPLTPAEQDGYFADMAQVAAALGAAPVPRTRRDAAALIAATRPRLASDPRTREVAALVLAQRDRGEGAFGAGQALLFDAAIDLLPGWARRLHGLHAPTLTLPLVRAGTLAMAQTVRWAL